MSFGQRKTPVVFTLTKGGRKAFFAFLFKRERKRLKLTQQEMAKALRCSQSRLSKIEKGALEPGAWDLWWLTERTTRANLGKHFRLEEVCSEAPLPSK